MAVHAEFMVAKMAQGQVHNGFLLPVLVLQRLHIHSSIIPRNKYVPRRLKTISQYPNKNFKNNTSKCKNYLKNKNTHYQQNSQHGLRHEQRTLLAVIIS